MSFDSVRLPFGRESNGSRLLCRMRNTWLLLFNVGWCIWNTAVESVLNAAARLVYSARRSEHTTPLLRQLHWLKVPERIKFQLCVLVHRCLYNKASPYLAETLHLTTEVDAHCRLRSASTSTLTVPSTRQSTISDQAFPVAAVCAWNSLPSSIRTVSSLNAFGRPQNNSVQGIVWWPDKTAPIFTNNWHLQPVTFVHCPCNS